MANYLDLTGLTLVLNKIKTWVEGKGYITSETSLSKTDSGNGNGVTGITVTGHAITVSKDTTFEETSNKKTTISTTSTTEYPCSKAVSDALANKQDTISSSNKVAASNISGLATVATSGSYSDLSNKPTIPTITDTYSATSTNGMSGKAVASAISGKQDTLSASNKLSTSYISGLATVATSGSYNDLSNKPTIPTITDTYSATSSNGMSGKAVASAISGITSFTYEVVTELPTTGVNGKIYLILDSDTDSYYEYIWIGTGFEKLGSAEIDAKDEICVFTQENTYDEVASGVRSGKPCFFTDGMRVYNLSFYSTDNIRFAIQDTTQNWWYYIHANDDEWQSGMVQMSTDVASISTDDITTLLTNTFGA